MGKAPVKAAVNLVYSLERGELNLSVAEALLQMQEAPLTPAVMKNPRQLSLILSLPTR